MLFSENLSAVAKVDAVLLEALMQRFTKFLTIWRKKIKEEGLQWVLSTKMST